MQHIHRRLDDHLIDYRDHVADDLLKHDRQDRMHDQNMEAIRALTRSTQGVVDVYTTVDRVQKFAKWVAGFAVIGWILTHYVVLAP